MKQINENIIRKIISESLKNFLLENDCDELMGFHASGVKFDKFSLDFMGSGEGSQQYGYGIYVTGNKDTGEYYTSLVAFQRKYKNVTTPRKAITNNDRLLKVVRWIANAIYVMQRQPKNYPINVIVNDLSKKFSSIGIDNKYIEMLSRCNTIDDLTNIGNAAKKELVKDEEKYLYSVEIPDGPYINWDETDTETNVNIYKEIDKVFHISETIPPKRSLFNNFGRMFEKIRGFHNGTKATSEQNNYQKQLSEILHKMGYKGIEVAIGRRMGVGGDGRGSNYVIFDANDIEIKEVVKA